MSEEVDASAVNRGVFLDGFDKRLKKVRPVALENGPSFIEGVGRRERDALIARQVLPSLHRPLSIAAAAVEQNDQRYWTRGGPSGNEKLIRSFMAAELERASRGLLA